MDDHQDDLVFGLGDPLAWFGNGFGTAVVRGRQWIAFVDRVSTSCGSSMGHVIFVSGLMTVLKRFGWKRVVLQRAVLEQPVFIRTVSKLIGLIRLDSKLAS